MIATDTTRPTVLVADPAVDTAGLIARQLDWAGYRVTTASSGFEALELIAELRPAACVLEVMLGDGPTGYELVRRMRAVPETALTPVILMSARAGKLDRDFAFTVGSNDYFKKPFRCGELIVRLERLVPIQPRVRRRVVRRTPSCRPQRAIALTR